MVKAASIGLRPFVNMETNTTGRLTFQKKRLGFAVLEIGNASNLQQPSFFRTVSGNIVGDVKEIMTQIGISNPEDAQTKVLIKRNQHTMQIKNQSNVMAWWKVYYIKPRLKYQITGSATIGSFLSNLGVFPTTQKNFAYDLRVQEEFVQRFKVIKTKLMRFEPGETKVIKIRMPGLGRLTPAANLAQGSFRSARSRALLFQVCGTPAFDGANGTTGTLDTEYDYIATWKAMAYNVNITDPTYVESDVNLTFQPTETISRLGDPTRVAPV